MPDYRHAGVGWPNGQVDNAAVLALPSPDLLMLAPEGRYHLDAALAAGKRVLWRAIPRIGNRPAELGWSPARYVEEALNLILEPSGRPAALVWANELDLNYERGDDADDFDGLELRYRLIGGWAYSVGGLLRQRLPGVRLHWPAWTPDHGALDRLAAWRSAADACDVVDFHAYDSLDAIRRQYTAYRAAFPGKPLALTEWHCRGDLDEERRVLAWLADLAMSDPLFEAAYFFIWRWHDAPGWWDDRWDVEHDPTRLALFMDPPVATEAPMPDLRAYAREAAARLGVPPAMFERQIDQESGFDPNAHNDASGADGIAQIVVRWHPEMAGRTRDPIVSMDYAAALMAGHYRQFGSWRKALAAYNWGPGNVGGYTSGGIVTPPWDGTRAGLPAETRRYLDAILGAGWPEPGAPSAPTVAYDAAYPAIAQNDPWSCAPTAARWALHAVGRRPTEEWIERTMLAEGVVSAEAGLLDATGAGLADFVTRQYGEFGYAASSQDNVSFQAIAEEAGPYPILIGGRRWGQGGHWAAVRAYDRGRDVLLLANPADGWGGVGQEMTREQFARLGPFALVRITHPDLIPANPPAPQPPAPADVAALQAQLADKARRLDQAVSALGYAAGDLAAAADDIARAATALADTLRTLRPPAA